MCITTDPNQKSIACTRQGILQLTCDSTQQKVDEAAGEHSLGTIQIKWALGMMLKITSRWI
jgi:hypothetical protein